MSRVWAAAIGTALYLGTTAVGATGPAATDANDLIARAYRAAYSLDYDEAANLARKASTEDPDSSRSHRALASVLWLHMLFDRGNITVDNFMGSVTKSEKSIPPVPVALDVEFQVELRRATDLAEARLKRDPSNLDAQQDVAAVSALQASYATSIKGSLMSAYGPAKRAFQMDDDVLAKD